MIMIKTKARLCSECRQSFAVEHLRRVAGSHGQYCAKCAPREERHQALAAERRRAEIVAEVQTWAAVAAGRRAYDRRSSRPGAAEPTHPSGARRTPDQARLDLARRERGESYVRMLLDQETR